MARETKVGLLVGLAFIICFAVILANHGQRGILVETMPGFPVTVTRVGQPSLRDEKVATAQTNSSAPVSGSTPPRVDRDLTVKTSPLKLHFQDPNSVAAQNEEMGAMARQIEDLKSQISALLAQNQAANTSSIATPSTGGGVILTATPVGDLPASPVTAEVPVDGDAGTVRRHVVEPGDTLTSIADRYYASKSSKSVNLIYEANRMRIKDIDRVPLGVELLIPVNASAQAPVIAKNPSRAMPTTAGEEQARATAKPSAPPQKKESPREKLNPLEKNEPYRWYQVRKNDRYVSIARQQLGDEKRWKEIFELNKEKFPKEGMIREGVRIKLPSDDMADSRGKRR